VHLVEDAALRLGERRILSYWTGTSIACVTRWCSTASRNASGENLPRMTFAPPRAVVMNQVTLVVFE
jgi:hypothetical protein